MKLIKKIASVLVVVGVFYGGYAWMQAAEFKENALPLEAEQVAAVEVVYQVEFEESYTLCEEYRLGCKAKKTDPLEDLSIFTLEEIKKKYPPKDWNISQQGSNLTICRMHEGLCEEHKKVYHLGLNSTGEYLTICYGPKEVGSNGGVYLMTDIALTGLKDKQREKIIRGAYETSDLEELQGILDSLSEGY